VTTAFNLLDERWIPVRDLDGNVREVGLLELFDSASRLEGLAETSPPNLIALYRILLAITHRALTHAVGTWKDADRARWYQDGMPAGAIRDYLEHWRNRFWVFHPEFPFMQVAELSVLPETKDKRKPWTQIALDRSSGNTPVVFDHAVDSEPVQADVRRLICELMGFLQFTPGGLVKAIRSSDRAGALANTAACLPLSPTLERTLCLNLHPANFGSNSDLPAWEQHAPHLPDLLSDGLGSSGPNDRYSRRSRAVLFLPDSPEGLTVGGIRFAAGIALATDENDTDPMASYRVGKKGAVRLSFTDGRALWRELPSILPDPAGQSALPAPVLTWAANLHRAAGRWDASLSILVAGLASEQAKLLRWRAERLVLPAAIVADADAAQWIRLAVGRAEKAYSSARTIVTSMVAGAMPEPDHKDTRARARAHVDVSGFAGAFFVACERALPGLLKHVANRSFDDADAYWASTLIRATEDAWATAIASTGRSPRALRAEALTRPRFQAFVRTLRSGDVSPSMPSQEIDA